MNYKKMVIRLTTLITFLTGSYFTLLTGLTVFDKSYMATLGALGGRGAREVRWAVFGSFIILAITSLVIFVVSFKKPTKT